MRREFNAARRVLDASIAREEDPLVIEKRREHEERLVVALQQLRRDSEDQLNALYVWGDTGPEPVSLKYWHHGLELPETLDVRCLFQHLDPQDDILVAYRESAEALMRGVELSTQFSTQVITQLQETKLPLRSDATQTVPGIDNQFLPTVSDIALARIHRGTRMDGVRTAEGGG